MKKDVIATPLLPFTQDEETALTGRLDAMTAAALGHYVDTARISLNNKGLDPSWRPRIEFGLGHAQQALVTATQTEAAAAEAEAAAPPPVPVVKPVKAAKTAKGKKAAAVAAAAVTSDGEVESEAEAEDDSDDGEAEVESRPED